MSDTPRFECQRLEPRVLLAADPITQDHPLWTVMRGSAAIDGVLDDADWQIAEEIYRTQAYRDSAATVRLLHDDAGLYVSAEVSDAHLWADGNGGGAGNRFELENDDSLLIYVDPDGSRDPVLQPNDRVIGVSIAPPGSPNSGSGMVARGKYVRGDGNGAAPDVIGGALDDLPSSLPDGFIYATTLAGTVNNDADTDRGWVTEWFIPWAALGMNPPAHAHTVGMNFDLIFDDSGGTRDLNDRRGAPERFEFPAFVDDHILGVHSAASGTQAGLRGPVNYAEAMFVNPFTGARPAAVSGLASAHTTGYSTRLVFDAPAATEDGRGHVSGYEIRTSTSPIANEADWARASVYAQAYAPRLAGMAEEIRLIGLEPGTTTHVSVRAVDAAGRLGALAPSLAVSTQAESQDASEGRRVVPSPLGRTFVHETGEPFVPVGDHLGVSWGDVRNLFPGEIWDRVNNQFVNFADPATHPDARAEIEAYFDEIAAHGVNTMRVYLELQNVHWQGNPGPLPRGLYWLEHGVGQFNPDMRAFLEGVMELADEHGIHLILSPFDSFSYDEAFGIEGPWSSAFGGPLTDINDFFQAEGTLEIAKARLDEIVSWVRASEHARTVIGYETLSEWESFEWTLNAEGDAEPGRETEFRTRALWVQALARHLRDADPDRLTLNSTITQSPRGPVARLVFLDRAFDAHTPHLYTNANEEPINNPTAFREVLAAQEQARLTAYWVSRMESRVPVLNGEWGMTRADWPGGVPAYGPSFSQAEDEANFRAVSWAGFAAGQAGMGLRIATDELTPFGFQLTDAMRDSQLVFDRFLHTGSVVPDFASHALSPWVGRVETESAHALHAFASSDGAQGLAYVLHDRNVSFGTVTGGVLVLRGLDRDALYDYEVWLTLPGTTQASVVRTGVFSADGTLRIDLPSFAEGVAVKFRAQDRPVAAQPIAGAETDGALLTFYLNRDRQPVLEITDALTGARTTQELAVLTGFARQAVDLVAYRTVVGGSVQLALTDTQRTLWLMDGTPGGSWTLTNLTAALGAGAPGLAGDLTVYQPSWGTIHLAGLSARGHAVNYWFDGAGWNFTDLTEAFGGPVIAGGLTGYVAPWDGLNLAGLNEQGEVVVYWWAPGIEQIFGEDRWDSFSLTERFEGPTFSGQLDAYVTPWGGLNVAGTDASGRVVTYWWAPGIEDVEGSGGDPNRWLVADLTAASSAPSVTPGVEVVVDSGGGLNVASLTGDSSLVLMRWTPADPIWSSTDVGSVTGGPAVVRPVAGASAGGRAVFAAAAADERSLTRFDLVFDGEFWTFEGDGPVLPPV